ncbi:amino acid adenylation domain-containing protein [Xenorhabdus sp. XENO-7]|uniref:Amino acid adenylation domain-containing protein n=1 Tax=Xenorhabdus aichiensis TaxID=3025874 RepID=A0ABT5M2V6_9GAMM|nr:non-ribosomal peptide synthetase [Xenorhabdus aichiensis]MDC9622013.1 amino acid adenylation domain-containing protein [Xenorhabdus aichiensis]
MSNETLYSAVRDTLENCLGQKGNFDFSSILGSESNKCAELLSVFLQVKVTLQDLQSCSSVSCLVERLIDRTPKLRDMSFVPATPGQKGIWLLDQTLKQPESYNVPLLMEVDTALNWQFVRMAVAKVAEITPALCTHFSFNQNRLYQVISKEGNINITRKRLAKGECPEQIIKQMARKHFDLSEGGLSDICLITDDSNRSWLACCFHHIIVDAPSVRITLSQLLNFYSNLTEGLPLPSKKVGATYTDFTQWQSSLLARPESASMKEYWKEVLSPRLSMIDLPADHSRKYINGVTAGYCHVDITRDDELKIYAQARQLAMTPFMYMAMCWQFLLHRLSGQRDIIIGIPFTLREHSEFEETVGYFINTLPFRTYIDSDASVNDLAVAVRNRFIEAHVNKHFPFGDIVASTGQSYGQGNPIFQTLLVIPDTKDDIFTHLPFAVKLTEYYSQAAKYDLTLFIDTASSHRLVMEYNAELFEEKTINYWLQLFRHIALMMGECDTTRLGEIEILTHEEQVNIVNRSSTSITEDYYQCFVSEIRKFASEHPNATALVSRKGDWTYGWLENRANQIAEYMYNNFKIGAGTRVGLLLNRNEDSIVSLLAVLKTGASYVPVDPSYPRERIDYMLNDAAVDYIITTSDFVSSLPVDIHKLLLNEVEFSAQVDWQPVQRKPDDELYVIYTSGSTGQPKGVRLLNKTLSNLLAWQKEITVCREGAYTLHYMSLSFDVSVQEIFGTLCTGGKLYISDEEERKDLHHLQGVIEARGIQRAYFPYVALQHLAQLSVMNNATLLTLEEVYSTGEQLVLTSSIKHMFKDGRRLINLYGPSESHVCSAYVMPSDVSTWGDAASIGYPLPGFSLLALDERRQLVPAGVAGELWIVSDFLSPGYHNKGQETNSRFLASEWPEAVSQQSYKSGDLVKLECNDTFTYLGRMDNQLKIRGFRIEPSEVEAAINALEGVKVSAVIGKEMSAGNRQLVAFIAGGNTLDQSKILVQLREHLPDYMIPSELVILNDLPTTPSGKIDRKALHHIDIQQVDNESCDEEELNSIEREVRDLWQRAFPNRVIKVTDDFFTIGGHSLLATQLVYLLRQQFKVDFPLKLLFNNPTLRDMSTVVEKYLSKKDHSSSEIEKVFVKDAAIEHDWRYAQKLRMATGDDILLTGATGFLGIYLLRLLSNQVNGKVVCLVRADDPQSGLNRLIKNACEYGIENDIDFSRVAIVVGDVASENLGLDEQDYRRLSGTVSTVYHAAAHINFVLPYSSVKGANVDGTVNIINFCCHQMRKKLEYISTIAVFSPKYPKQPITESSIPDYPQSLSIGYTQSKWVAEQYVHQARKQGVNINVYRIGRISGDSITGACQEDDFLWRQIKSFIQMGVAPFAETLATDLLPVDFVGKAIVALSLSNTDSQKNYHLFHPKGTDFIPVYKAIESTGHSIETMSEETWLEKLEQMVVDGYDVALGSLIHLYKEEALNIGDCTYNNEITINAIKASGFDFPNINVNTFTRMISYFMENKVPFKAKVK